MRRREGIGIDGEWNSNGPGGGPELEGVEDRREVVDAHVAQAAGAEVPPAAPLERDVSRVEGRDGGGAEPEVPIQGVRHGRGVCGRSTPWAHQSGSFPR